MKFGSVIIDNIQTIIHLIAWDLKWNHLESSFYFESTCLYVSLSHIECVWISLAALLLFLTLLQCLKAFHSAVSNHPALTSAVLD